MAAGPRQRKGCEHSLDGYLERQYGFEEAKIPNIIECVEDPALLGHFFSDQQSWEVWKAYLAGLFAVPMEPERLAVFQKYTGRLTAPQFEFDKSFLVCGRRSGKSVILAVIACYLGCFRDFRKFMSPGESWPHSNYGG